jgi:hypothetical protein
MNWPPAEAPAAAQHAVPDCVQDLHHHRDHDQRPLGAALVRGRRRAGTDIARHFIGLTTNVAAAGAFGIRTTFGFWDWVGGRYSVWSAIGLPLAIAIGAAGFRDFLAGAHAMDQHFRSAPLADNLPVRLGLLDVWYRNFLGFTSRSIAPYHSALQTLSGLSAAAGDGEQRQAGGPGRPGAALWHLARAVGRAGHQRAARLFPDAAPGHGRGAGGVCRGDQGAP